MGGGGEDAGGQRKTLIKGLDKKGREKLREVR